MCWGLQGHFHINLCVGVDREMSVSVSGLTVLNICIPLFGFTGLVLDLCLTILTSILVSQV